MNHRSGGLFGGSDSLITNWFALPSSTWSKARVAWYDTQIGVVTKGTRFSWQLDFGMQTFYLATEFPKSREKNPRNPRDRRKSKTGSSFGIGEGDSKGGLKMSI